MSSSTLTWPVYPGKRAHAPAQPQPQPVYLLGQCARHAPAPSPCMRPRQHASTGSMTDMVRLIHARHTPSALTDPGPVRCPRSAAATATAAHHACMSAARQTSSRGTQWLHADRRLRPPSRRCSATASSRSREALHRCDAAGAGALSRRPGRAGALHNALPLCAGDRGSSGHGAAAGVLRVSCAAGVPPRLPALQQGAPGAFDLNGRGGACWRHAHACSADAAPSGPGS